MNEQELLELRARNQVRLDEAIAKLGTKYLVHPDNRVTKQKFRRELKRNKRLMNNV